MLCAGLQLAETLLGAAVPPAACQRISADRTLPGIVSRVVNDLFLDQRHNVEESNAGKSLFQLLIRDRLGDQISYALAQMEPTVGDWAAVPLPPQMQFLHYAIRPIRLLWRFGTGGF